MTALIVITAVLAWLTGAYLTARQYAMNELERRAQFHASLGGLYPKGTPLIDGDDRSMAWGEAWAICWFLWPFVLGGYAARRVINLKPLVPPTERARLEQLELEELRALAAKYRIKGGEQL